jgi:hypothetical protein
MGLKNLAENKQYSPPYPLFMVGTVADPTQFPSIEPEPKVTIFVGWVEPVRLCWVSYLNPTDKN